jgi:hypothetical protein
MYRFHVDTWCFGRYYPLVGDSGWFGARTDQYQGVRFQRPGRESINNRRDPVLAPAMFTFMGRLHELTQDPSFIQAAVADRLAQVRRRVEVPRRVAQLRGRGEATAIWTA